MKGTCRRRLGQKLITRTEGQASISAGPVARGTLERTSILAEIFALPGKSFRACAEEVTLLDRMNFQDLGETGMDP
jgi:hypothetical protein